MGEVYRARDSLLERDVAIKVLPECFARDPDALARFQAEARAVAALEHSHILVLHDVGTEGGISFAVTELLEGETLASRLARAPLPWRKAALVGTALADGLGAAHAKGIIHRDLKPANIFLGNNGQIKILDFGLARRAPAEPVRDETVPYVPAVTEPMAVYGTAPYMSPEQVHGLPADARSDIFSLGCVLYEMVRGRRAFAKRTREETLAAIVRADPVPLLESTPDVPPELVRVIRHCLEKNPDERFQAARDVSFALRDLQGDAPASRGAGRRLPRRALAAALAALVLLAAGLGLYLHWHGGRPAEPPRPIDTLAVLPFVYEGRDPEAEYLSDGLAENLVRNLSGVRTLKVRPFRSALPYKGKSESVSDIGKALQVQAVIVGRVSKWGEELSVHVELVDVGENHVLWSEHYRHKMGNLFALQDEMSQQIAESLRRNLSGEEKERLRRHYTKNPEAYRFYLLGLFHWNKRSKDGLELAIGFFKQALEKDKRFALAYVGLADCYNVQPGYGYTEKPPRKAFADARAMASKALEIDPGLAEAHTALGYAKTHEWDWAGAEKEFQSALSANPNDATGRQWYACYLASMGRHAEAAAEIYQARELDPTSRIINGWVAMILCYGQRMDQALTEGKEAVGMDPHFAVNHFFLGIIYRRQGQYDAAIAEFLEAVKLDPHSTTYLTGLGEVYGVSQRPDKARQILKELDELSRKRYVSPYGVAAVYAGLGEKEKALDWLEKAYEGRDDGLANLRIDPVWESLRSEPRFRALVKRLKFPT
jgi:TolB-like protein/Flp pilus assembly protein TadD